MIVYPQVLLSLFVTIKNDSHQDNNADNQDNHHPEAPKKMYGLFIPMIGFLYIAIYSQGEMKLGLYVIYSIPWEACWPCFFPCSPRPLGRLARLTTTVRRDPGTQSHRKVTTWRAIKR